MAEKSSNSPAMAFILEFLKGDGEAAYADVRAAAEKDGHNIYPIMYGRAKTLLGLITADSKRKRRRRKADSRPAKLRQGGVDSADSSASELSGFLERYRELEEERNRYRAALLSVEKMLRDTLESTS